MKTVSKMMVAVVPALLMACGGAQPTYYRVSLDGSNIRPQSLAGVAGCYAADEKPTEKVDARNYRVELEWVFWNAQDGKDTKYFVDIGGAGGAFAGPLGGAPALVWPELIESTDKASFAAAYQHVKRNEAGGNAVNEVTTTSNIGVTLDELSAVTKGSVQVTSAKRCNALVSGGCDGVTDYSCSATMPFIGRKLEVQQMAGYGTNL